MASRRNSVTFDELFLVPQGARGVLTGEFSKGYEHPPGMLIVYGAAARLAGTRLPREYDGAITPPELAKVPGTVVIRPDDFFNYGQEVFFHSGNDPERIAFASRLIAVLLAMGLGGAVALFVWRRAGAIAALCSATIVMFLPDVMAHAGIAYNDLPGALAFFLGLWAWDNAVRTPTPARTALAAAVTGAALVVKFSEIAIVPAALALFLVEAATRGRDPAWYKRIGVLLPLAVAIIWLLIALIYRGDWALTHFRGGLASNVAHVETGHGARVLLLGRVSDHGFWYFFPLGLVLKTPAALHILAIVAMFGYAAAWRWKRDLLRSPLRMLLVGVLVYLAFLLRARLNIGVRHALPLLPLLAVLTGVGVALFWEQAAKRLQVVVAVLLLVHAASTLAYYPWFLSYLTEYVPDRREAGHRIMVDSNLDWGQGLLDLRDFMRDEQIDGIYLSYFGSALPEGYGIRYAPMTSFLPLPRQPRLATEPKWVVISATNLAGLYFEGDDPFRQFRRLKPDRVLANSIYAYRVR